MGVLQGKKILLGVSGGIAAYKTASLIRLFIKSGAEVQVIMTPSASDFVTPLTLSTLSKKPVFSSFMEDMETGVWNNHVALGLWADLMLIAPATANTLSKMSNGTADNLLLATYLSAKCPVYFAPAMDLDMYKHPSTIQTFSKLKDFGNVMIPAESGELASGLSGEGRMAEPENIIRFIENDLHKQAPLFQKKVLITAGPTYEAIDPVRFIGNHASGKMGFALAETAASLGANVVLVSGPTHLQTINKAIQLISVQSADDMYKACKQFYDESEIVIASAAVADYKPETVFDQKIKKKSDVFELKLVKTVDILSSLGAVKKNQFLVGFALETENELDNAKAKLAKKNLDMIVLNSMNDKGAGFGGDQNKVTIIHQNQEIISMDLKSKMEVAQDIFNQIIHKIDA
uniref:bifunctional phosphopantothenoylcysteine decarboxylase/phosphopantothenate--cysteine ligase CoaBC n=1 Tax=Flavobacterium sp. TaxID=239 RepID=UPI00404ADB0D